MQWFISIAVCAFFVAATALPQGFPPQFISVSEMIQRKKQKKKRKKKRRKKESNAKRDDRDQF